MHKFFMRLRAQCVGRQPVECGCQRRTVASLLRQPVAVVAACRQRRGYQRLQVVGHVMQRIAFLEIDRRTVRLDVVANVFHKQTLRRVDHLAVVERERGHCNQLDPVALPVVAKRAGQRARLRVDLRDVTVSEFRQERHRRVSGVHRQRARGHVVGEDQTFEMRFVDRVEARFVGSDPRVQQTVDQFQIAVVTGGAPGECGIVAQQIEILLGFDALIVDPLRAVRCLRYATSPPQYAGSFRCAPTLATRALTPGSAFVRFAGLQRLACRTKIHRCAGGCRHRQHDGAAHQQQRHASGVPRGLPGRHVRRESLRLSIISTFRTMRHSFVGLIGV